ncbi:FAD-binding protein [Nostocoides sp. F2B08]|uniref:FAD-binding oxidoreductase n=1 Tax=Nostocoides sp. F2B08 TaxID=2653936 RepID=UPI001263DAE2|nr:FAD-binding oxidoreductase [Tetrasphaera sp. F2B08]KAB7744223.1 FAD-binding protein [Tetrasphaera sp. F2B08]
MAPRSWWGWGNVEDAVTGAEEDALVARVAGLLPDHDFTVHQPPEVSDLDLPPSRVVVPNALAAIASPDPEDRVAHARGKAYRDVVRNLEGDLAHTPDVVLRPRGEQDVVDALDWAASAGVAIVPYGGGTSVVGGVEPRFDAPAASLDLTGLDQVLEIDRASRAARVQAGVLGPALEDQLRPHGLTLRHFPQSFEFSSLGGWLSTRAGGHYATVLTHIDDLTESLRVVTPAGVSESRRLPGSGAGPSPDRLFLGSEGALGVITEAWVRLQDRPGWQRSVTVDFDSFDDAAAATRAVAQSGLHPSNCRLLDPMESMVGAGLSTKGGLLVLAFESADHPVGPWLDRGLEIVRDHGGHPGRVVAKEPGRDSPPPTSPADAWRSSFLRMPYQRDAVARRSLIVETFETACTWDRFDELHAAITTAAYDVMTSVGAPGVLTCRFTHVYPDGPAPYYGVYASGRWGSLVPMWDEIKAGVSEAIIAHGGTITHHHAVGRDHAPWYARQRPEPFAAALRAVKAALDPRGVLNPGVLGL